MWANQHFHQSNILILTIVFNFFTFMLLTTDKNGIWLRILLLKLWSIRDYASSVIEKVDAGRNSKYAYIRESI